MNIRREFNRYVRVLWNWAWLIVLGAVLAGGINYYIAINAAPKYQASMTLMVGQFIKEATPDQMEVGVSDRLASYYLELLRRQPVLEGVKQELGLTLPNDELAGKVAARIVPSTAFIEISAVDANPTQAVKLANAFAHNLIKQSPTAPENQQQAQRQFIQKQLDDLQTKIEDGRKTLQELNQSLSNGTTAAEITDTRGKIKALETQIDSWQTNYTDLLRLTNASSPNSINILEESNQASKVKTLSPYISAAIAAAVGALLAIIFAFVLEYLDDRLKSHEDITTRLKISVLGHIPALKKGNKKRKKEAQNGSELYLQPEAVQAYEIMSTNILFSDVFQNNRKSILLTGPEVVKDQANIAVNLAISTVGFEQEVLLVDANTQNPELHEALGLENDKGFYEVFYGSGTLGLEDKVQETAVPNLYVMTAGQGNASSQGITVLRPGTHRIYNLPDHSLPGDFVIFNCDSILTDKTVRLLSPHVSGVILLCQLNRTRSQEMKAAIEVIERLKGNVLGVVTLEKAKRSLLFLPRGGRSRTSQRKARIDETVAAADSGSDFVSNVTTSEQVSVSHTSPKSDWRKDYAGPIIVPVSQPEVAGDDPSLEPDGVGSTTAEVTYTPPLSNHAVRPSSEIRPANTGYTRPKPHRRNSRRSGSSPTGMESKVVVGEKILEADIIPPASIPPVTSIGHSRSKPRQRKPKSGSAADKSTLS